MSDQETIDKTIETIGLVEPDAALSMRQQLAMLILISGGTNREAGKAAGVTEYTVSRWLNNDADFKRLYNERKAGVWAAHEAKIAQLTAKALDMLGRLLGMGDDYIRIEAIKIVLKMSGLLPTGTRVSQFGGQVNIGEKQVNITKEGDGESTTR